MVVNVYFAILEKNTNEGGYCVKTSNRAINVTRSRYTLGADNNWHDRPLVRLLGTPSAQ